MISSSACVCLRQTLYFGTEAAGPDPCGELFIRTTMRSASGNGRGFRITALITGKMAVLAPIPSASAETAVAVKPDFGETSERRV
jgi:hypothetical protein